VKRLAARTGRSQTRVDINLIEILQCSSRHLWPCYLWAKFTWSGMCRLGIDNDY